MPSLLARLSVGTALTPRSSLFLTNRVLVLEEEVSALHVLLKTLSPFLPYEQLCEQTEVVRNGTWVSLIGAEYRNVVPTMWLSCTALATTLLLLDGHLN